MPLNKLLVYVVVEHAVEATVMFLLVAVPVTAAAPPPVNVGCSLGGSWFPPLLCGVVGAFAPAPDGNNFFSQNVVTKRALQ